MDSWCETHKLSPNPIKIRTGARHPCGGPTGFRVGSGGFRGGFRAIFAWVPWGFRWVPGGSVGGSAGVPHVKNLASELVSLVGIEAGRGEFRFPEKMGSVRVSSLLLKLKKGNLGYVRFEKCIYAP